MSDILHLNIFKGLSINCNWKSKITKSKLNVFDIEFDHKNNLKY